MPDVFYGGGDLAMGQPFGIDGSVSARICPGSLSQQIGNSVALEHHRPEADAVSDFCFVSS